jgi:hypothetical protein
MKVKHAYNLMEFTGTLKQTEAISNNTTNLGGIVESKLEFYTWVSSFSWLWLIQMGFFPIPYAPSFVYCVLVN